MVNGSFKLDEKWIKCTGTCKWDILVSKHNRSCCYGKQIINDIGLQLGFM